MNPILAKNIVKLYWITAVSSSQFQSVVGTIFLLSKGFSLGELFLLGSVYAVAALLSEIPTGSYSDRIGRKNSLVLSTLIEIPALVVIIFTHSFWTVAAMNVLFGIAASFRSGTDTAILYDTLQAIDQEKEFKKVSGRQRWLGSWGGALGGILGGLIAKFDLSYAWWAWVAAQAVVLAVQLTLVEPPEHEPRERTGLWSHLSESLSQAFRGAATYFILYQASIWLFFWLGYSLWQPYLQLSGLPVAYFGLFYAGISLVSGFSSKYAQAAEEKIGMRLSLFLIPVLLAAAFFLESRLVFVFSFVFIAVQALASGYFGPVLDDYVNRRIPSTTRATVLSVQNMLSRLAFTLVAPLAGYFIDLYSLRTALLLMAGILVILASVFAAFFKKSSRSS